LIFPKNYPISPPNARLQTYIPHSHVYGTWICLDMLETHYSPERYSGWSSAYSIQSILIQLQSFLFNDVDSNISMHKATTSAQETLKFKCNGCSHDMKKKKPFPFQPFWKYRSLTGQTIKFGDLSNSTESEIKQLDFDEKKVFDLQDWSNLTKNFNLNYSKKKIIAKSKQIMKKPEPPIIKKLVNKMYEKTKVEEFKSKRTVENGIFQLTDDLIIHDILPFLSTIDLQKIKNVSKHFYQLSAISTSFYSFQSNVPICFHSKVTYQEETLGVGINIQLNPFTKNVRSKISKKLKKIVL